MISPSTSPTSRRLAFGLAVALAFTLAPVNGGTVAVASAADASADIPGTPLPGPVVAGRLGGAIYDVVYSLNVPPGHVIVASLTGTVGTDFDIYLFDASATTVLSDAGLIAKTTGPTSTESLSVPSRFGGTYYIDLNGATDLEGDFRLTVQTVPDPTPPTVAVALSDGRQSVNDPTVGVTLTASDDLSGVVEMAMSADGVAFGPWRPYAPRSTWPFPAQDGPARLWVKVRNGVGLESAVADDTVTIDTVPPAVTAIAPTPGLAVSGLRPRFTVAFNEAMEAASWVDLGLIVQSASAELVAGTYTYDVAQRTGSFVPTQALNAGALYIVTVGNVRDVAGNRVASPGSWSITPLSPTTLVAVPAPPVVARGGSARIDLALSGAPMPTSVEVQRASGSGAFEPFASVPIESGVSALVVTPVMTTTYRFAYPGSFGVAPATAEVRVLVRRSVVLAGRDSSTLYRARTGGSVRLTAAISPAGAGVSVSFRLYRLDTRRHAWVYAGSHGRKTDASGRASYTWTVPTAGSYYWRATVASTPEYANNSSPVYRWSVAR